jgi:proton glutamate symport protein
MVSVTTRPASTASPRRGAFSPVPSLVALALGILSGFVVFYSGNEYLLMARDTLEPLGFLWIRALRMIVFPLVISTLLVAILNGSRLTSAGRVGSAALAVFLVVLCSGGLYSFLFGSALIGLVPAGSGAAIASVSADARALVQNIEPMKFGDWLNSLIPTNPFGALAEGHLLPVIIFTVLFGLALNTVSGPGREIVHQFFDAIFRSMMTLVGWILIPAPLAIFILCMSFASNMGTEFTTILVNFLLIECTLLVVATLLLYPLTCVLGGVSLRRFSSSVLPAQMVAVSTRSSLAALPALLEGARGALNLKPAVANLVLPLATSVFKANRPITSMCGFLFLAHLFEIDLSSAQVLTFFATTLILSFSSVGIPLGGNSMLSLPAYLAAGIPIEGYLLLKTVDSIPDILKTLINVTGDLSVATILDRHF